MKKAAAVLLVLAAASPAYAQDRSTTPVTEVDFTDADEVTGDRVSPYIDLIGGRRRQLRQSLIRARTTFRPELVKSVEDI